MTLPRPPTPVALSAVLIALTGGVALVIGFVRHPEWLVLGAAAFILAAGVWRGSAWARWTGIVAGLAALLPAGYGVWGSAVVAQQWLACSDGGVAAVATSYPEGYCGMVNWVIQFGTGITLISVGLVGLITISALLRHSGYFRKDRAAPNMPADVASAPR